MKRVYNIPEKDIVLIIGCLTSYKILVNSLLLSGEDGKKIIGLQDCVELSLSYLETLTGIKMPSSQEEMDYFNLTGKLPELK